MNIFVRDTGSKRFAEFSKLKELSESDKSHVEELKDREDYKKRLLVSRDNIIESRCPFCGRISNWNPTIYDGEYTNILYFECITCGEFKISRKLLSTDLDMIDCCIFHYNLNIEKDAVYINDENEIIEGANEHFVTKKELESYKPVDFSDKINKTLLSLSKIYDIFGDLLLYNSKIVQTLTFTPNEYRMLDDEPKDAYQFLNNLRDYGYIEINLPNSKMTIKGFEKINSLGQNSSKRTAFIAMSFKDDLKQVYEAIKETVEKCGYTAVRIDQKEHNNQIMPEIIYEIKECRFIIADFTGNRGGVYYEAGFGEALNKTVIAMNKKNSKVHFDIAQKSRIIWENEEDLKEKLENRIIATVGKRQILP